MDAGGVVPKSRKKVKPVGAFLGIKAPTAVAPNAGEGNTIEANILALYKAVTLSSDADNDGSERHNCDVAPNSPGQQLRHLRSHDGSPTLVDEVVEVDEEEDAVHEDISNVIPPQEKLTMETAEHGTGDNTFPNSREARAASKTKTVETDVGKDADVVERAASTAAEDAARMHSGKPTEPDNTTGESTPKKGRKVAKSPVKVIAASDIHV